ncbi:hypothetical protein llap_7191 [Limosa lapponica baueri]|uniref:Uncharacterized protein n=1 Tax=Limosa lapponica baueri TaxID=1758121 RepID=A0A2I0U8Y8_LIMLA|nr:hypothetical protein llap_7191 [Limosa lapponica baueri]
MVQPQPDLKLDGEKVEWDFLKDGPKIPMKANTEVGDLTPGDQRDIPDYAMSHSAVKAREHKRNEQK